MVYDKNTVKCHYISHIFTNFIQHLLHSNGIIDAHTFVKAHETKTILSIDQTPSASTLRKSTGIISLKIAYLFRTNPINLSTWTLE